MGNKIKTIDGKSKVSEMKIYRNCLNEKKKKKNQERCEQYGSRMMNQKWSLTRDLNFSRASILEERKKVANKTDIKRYSGDHRVASIYIDYFKIE